MNCKFVINKYAGSGLTRRQFSEMETFFRHHLGSFDYVTPKDRTDAVVVTQNLLKQGAEQIVAVGGDGTMNASLNGFFENGEPINKGAVLVVSKVGLGCDYYSSVAGNHRVKSWMELVANNTPKPVDVGLIEFEGGALTKRYFLNMASVGLTAVIVKQKEQSHAWVPSALKYTWPTIVSLFTVAADRFHITTPNGKFAEDAIAVTISKGAFAGRGMNFGLDVQLDDGLFEVTVFRKSNPFSMILRFYQLFNGKYAGEKEIRKLMANQIIIASDKQSHCEIDGELYGETEISISLAKQKLLVAHPQDK